MRTHTALAACLLGLLPALALGQTVTLSLSSGSDVKVNIAECNDGSITFTASSWTLSGTGTLASNSYYMVFATSSTSCPTVVNPSGTTNKVLVDLTATNGSLTGSGPTGVNLRTTLTDLGIGACTVGTTIDPLKICVLTTEADQTTVTTFKASGTIAFDLVRPGTPTGVSTAPGEGALKVSWAAPTSGSTPTSWKAEAVGVASIAGVTCNDGTAAAGGSCSTTGTTSTSCRITGLANDACYQVTVTGYSDSGNASLASAAAAGVPRETVDFWEQYRASGGVEAGGCGAGGASALSLLALAALAPRLRRRRP